jgi:hypothetical protein
MRAVLLCASFLSFISCNKEDEVKSDDVYPEFVVFGQIITPASCFSSETCVEVFKIQTGSLKEDSNDDIPNGEEPYNGNFDQTLSKEDYRNIESLFRNEIPKVLLDTPSGDIGSISDGDFVYTYFEYKTKDTHKFWKINTSSLALQNAEIQAFSARIQQAVNIASFN